MILQMLIIDVNTMTFKDIFFSLSGEGSTDCLLNIYLIDQPANEPNQPTNQLSVPALYNTKFMVFPISLPG